MVLASPKVTDECTAQTQRTNAATLRQKAQQALQANAAFLALPPGPAAGPGCSPDSPADPRGERINPARDRAVGLHGSNLKEGGGYGGRG
jgi:hypothetical protein